MKAKDSRSLLLLFLTLLATPVSHAADRSPSHSRVRGVQVAPLPPDAQIGFSIQEFLLCMQEGRGSGMPWTVTAQLCVISSRPAERRGAAHPGE